MGCQGLFRVCLNQLFVLQTSTGPATLRAKIKPVIGLAARNHLHSSKESPLNTR